MYLDGKPTHFDSVADVPAGWPWPDFKPEEFACHGSGKLFIVPEALDKLQNLRTKFGKPLKLNSAYRDPAYNCQVAHTGESGPHTTGRAFDISIEGLDAFEILPLLLECGFTGIGVQQKGPPAGRYIHIDDLTSDEGFDTRPWLWSY